MLLIEEEIQTACSCLRLYEYDGDSDTKLRPCWSVRFLAGPFSFSSENIFILENFAFFFFTTRMWENEGFILIELVK